MRVNGVEIDGKVMALSTAALLCIKKAGGDRPTANGWVMWKTQDGVTLADIYGQLLAA